MKDTYIISMARTPIGRFGGILKNISPVDLGALAMKGALERAGVTGENLDLFIYGNVLRAGHGQLIPRQSALKAGIPNTIDGYAIDMVCSSSMMATLNASMTIKTGEADLVLAGGVEAMSQAGFYITHKSRWGLKMLMGKGEPLTDIMVKDGLTDPITNEGMGNQTERVAEEFGITREELDHVAYESNRRAAEATESGILRNEIIPVEVKLRRETKIVDTDEGIRADTTMESLAKLRPAFTKDGVLTAGNSSQISDGAAAMLIASEEAVKTHNLKPIARILGGTWSAGEPWRFTETPVYTVKKLLDRTGMKLDDFDLFENNEAFAVNSILFNKVLGVPHEKMNVHGGAIALGHPLGASGVRIMIALINALQVKNGKRGLASLCHGTGGATAVAIELV